eukprot:m.333902 g.333902  ORF g.333902 m.333902 type:complete len:1372 (+) comp17243_c0_seq1:84-4199(+)
MLRSLNSSISTGKMGDSVLAPLSKAKTTANADDSTGFASRRLVWVPDDKEGYVRGAVKSQDGDKLTVEQDGNKRLIEISEGDVEKMNPPKFDQSEDMAELPNLNEASVLFNLQDRFASNLIHTYSGLFIVIINPFKKLPIYTDDVIAAYKGKRRGEVPPHIFAIADQAYRDMLHDREDQTILCTGESGAGKTENTKKVIQYIAYVAASTRSKKAPSKESAAALASSRRTTMGLALSSSQDLDRGELERQLLKANPVLETFGNAATCKNDNSSRFGKFIRIHFNGQGFIEGASIETYLLEKSRVVAQGAGERSFHAPYQLLKGADDALKKDLLLSAIQDYKFIGSSRYDLDDIDDDIEYEATNEAFELYGLDKDEIKDVWKIIAGVLTFGQLEFTEGKRGNDQAMLASELVAQKVGALFGVSSVDLIKCLTKPKMKAGTEIVHKAQTKEQVDSAVRALGKSTYERLFLWVVQRINASLDRTKGRGGKSFIGILDIAGFEIFEHNNFEQMLINYTNEKLQQLFNRRMFILEQEEYSREGIQWDFIDFGLDLQPTIDLIEGRNGMIPILDEQSIFPKATDKTLVDKYKGTYGKGKVAAYVEQTLRMKGDFAVKHYAGEVVYSAEGWLEKNKDPLNESVVSLFKESSNSFMKTLWSTTPGGTSAKVSARHRGALRTVAGIYSQQLKQLMETLHSTTPHFVRCIKPNHEKAPGRISPGLVLSQLQCGGVLEGIRIVRKGFPNRILFHDFRQRYKLLTPGAFPEGFVESAKAVELMVEALELDSNEYRIGHTKIFFRTGVLARLEEERDAKLSTMLIGLQAYCRGFLAREAFKFHVGDHQAVGIIQKNVRIYMQLRNWKWWRLYCRIKPMLKELQKRQDFQKVEEEISKLKDELAAEKEARAKAEAELDVARREIAELREAIESERETVVHLESIIADKNQKLAEWTEEMEASDLKLEEMLTNQQKLIHDKKELVDEIEDLKDDLAQGNADQAHMERLVKEKAELTEKLTAAEEDITKKTKQIKDLEASVTEKTSKVEELEHTSKMAVKQKTKAQNEIEDLTSQLDEVQSQLASSARQAKHHNAELKSEQVKSAGFAADVDRISGELHKTQTKVREAENQLSESVEKIEQLSKENKQLKKDLEELSATDDLEAKVKSLQAELRLKETSLAEVNEECDDLTDQLSVLKREKDALQMALQKLEAQQLDIDTVSGPKVKKLNAQIAELQDDLDSQAARNTRLLNDKKKLEADLKATESDLEAETGLREKDKRTIARLEKKIVFLSAESGDGAASAAEVDKLKKKNKDLRDALEEEEDKTAALKNGKRRLQRELDEQLELVATLEKEVADLRSKVRRYRLEFSAAHNDDDADPNLEGESES